MASPLDRAFVEILPDFSKFVSAFKKDIDKATTVLQSRFERTFARIERLASATARKVSAIFQDAFASMERDGRRAADEIEDALDSINPDDVDVDVDVDPRQVDDEVDDAVRRSRPPRIPIDIDIDREGTFSRFLSSITGVRLPIPGFILLGSAIGAAATAAIQFTAALAPAVGIVAGLPSVIGATAALMTTLTVATLGVGEAFEAAATGDAEEFSTAMEGLAPNVQNAAQAIRDMIPQLDLFRDRVQQAFFQDFDTVLNSLAEALLGPVTAGMTSVAGSINGVVQALTNVATSQEGIDFVTQSFAIMNGVVSQLEEPLALLFSALLEIGTAINTAFGSGAGEGIAAMITQFANFLSEAAASGEAVAWVDNAITVFQQLGDIISPIVSIIGSIGEAARATGGNILGVFGEALNTFAEFLETGEGMSTLINIFQVFNSVGALFGDILAGIAPALPPLIGGIGALVSAIAPLIPPLAIIVGNLLTALAPLFTAVAQAISPLIGPITTLAGQIGGFLVVAIEALMPWIEMLLEIFSSQLVTVIQIVTTVLAALLPIFEALTPLIEPLIMILEPFIELFAMLAEILLTALVPVIQVLGDILLWLVENVIVPVLIPVIEFLADMLTGVLGAAVEWIGDQFEVMGAGLEVVWNFIRDVIQDRIDEMVAVFTGLVQAYRVGWNLLNTYVFTPIKNGINTVKNVVLNHLSTIKAGWDGFVSFIKGIPGKISGSLSGMFNPLWSGFKGAINNVIDAWNGLSFTLPSANIPGIGEVGGATISTPNIPRLKVGGLSMGEGLASLDPNEAILPLEDQRTERLLAGALQGALAGLSASGGDTVTGAAPTIHVTVRIGERELDAMIDSRIDDNNQQMLRRARAGTRRNR